MLTALAVPENSPCRRRLGRLVVKTGRTSVAGRMVDRTADGWVTQPMGCVRDGTCADASDRMMRIVPVVVVIGCPVRIVGICQELAVAHPVPMIFLAGTGCRVPRLCPGAKGRSREWIDPALVNPD